MQIFALPVAGTEPEAAGPATCLVRDAVKGDGFYAPVIVPLADSSKGFLFASMDPGGLYEQTPVLWVTDPQVGARPLATLCTECGVALAARTTDAVWIWADSLWRSDGTVAGTWRLPSLPKPPRSHGSSASVVHGGRYYVVDCLDDLRDDCRVWSVDSRAKAWRKDWTLPSWFSGNPVEAVALGTELYAAIDDSLWRLTPSSGSAQLIWKTSDGSSRRFSLTGVNQRLLWKTENQLWSYEPQAKRLTLLTSGQNSDFGVVTDLKVVGGRAYVVADDVQNGSEIWSTDGTLVGTRRETALDAPALFGSGGFQVVAAGASVVFPLQEPGLPLGYFALAGPGKPPRLLHRRCSDCEPIPGSSTNLSGQIVAAGTRAFFVGGESATGFEPWVTDGTVAGTRLAHDVCAGPCSTTVSHLRSEAAGGLFLASHRQDRTTVSGTWATDGTSANTRRIGPAAVAPESYSLAPFASWDFRNARYVYPAVVPQPGLYAADPKVTDGAKALALTRREPKGLHPKYLLPFPGGLIFERAADLYAVPEWWIVSGNPPRLRAFAGGGSRGNCAYDCGYPFGAVANGFVYFQGEQLWRSDGTAAGTEQLTHEPGGLPLSFETPPFLSWRGRALTVVDGELWITDGTAAGTRHRELFETGSTNNLRILLDLGDELIFTVGSAYFNHAVLGGTWRTDGTPEGTRRFEVPLQPYSPICWVSSVGSRAVISTIRYNLHGDLVDLWAVDLATETWTSLGRLDGESCQGAPAVFRDSAYYVRARPVNDFNEEFTWRLWKVNLASGTSILKTGELTFPTSDPYNFRQDLVATDAGLWWSVRDSTAGLELWASDGTAGGTKLIDLFPGDYGSRPTGLTATPFGLFFAALSPQSGQEAWRVSPGVGKLPVAIESAAGSLSSEPTEFTTVGNRVYFAGARPDVGRELFFWSPNGCQP